MFDVRGVIAAHFEGKAPGTETMEQSYRELLTLMRAAAKKFGVSKSTVHTDKI